MRYFLTGATGFIGSTLARQLRDEGHEVRALVRDQARASALRELGCELVVGDIRDRASMEPGMRGVDGVFHLAAWYKIGVDEPDVAEAINVEGTRNVLQLMKALDIPRGVYTSTVAVFSDTRGQIVDEQYRHDGPMLTLYERTKHAAHYDVALPMIRDGLPLVIVMPGVVYGPGDQSEVGNALRMYLRRKLPVVPQGAAYSWTHVEDIATGHRAAMDRGALGESYILSAECRRLSDVLALAESLTSIPAPKMKAPAGVLRALAAVTEKLQGVVPLPSAYRAETLRSSAGVTYTASGHKAKTQLGFDPRPLEVGLAQTLEAEMASLGIAP